MGKRWWAWSTTLGEALLVSSVWFCGLPFYVLPNYSLSQTLPHRCGFSTLVSTIWIPHLSVATLLVGKNLK